MLDATTILEVLASNREVRQNLAASLLIPRDTAFLEGVAVESPGDSHMAAINGVLAASYEKGVLGQGSYEILARVLAVSHLARIQAWNVMKDCLSIYDYKSFLN